MPKAYAKRPGAAIRVGNFGEATADCSVEVPPEVAAELADHPDLRIEAEAPAQRLGRKPHKEEKEG